MSINLDLYRDIQQTAVKLKDLTRQTPLIKSVVLSQLLEANVYLKMENLQITGSFKVRGAFSKLLSLDESSRKAGIVTASSGNHGAGVAYAAKHLNIPTRIFVPNHAAPNKIKAIESLGGTVEKYGDDCSDAETYACEYAAKHGLEYVSPYNDYHVICGQGTIAYEIEQQLPSFDEIYVAIGGGGMMSGISGYIKQSGSSAKTIGCLPQASPCMYECVKASEIIQMHNEPTLSDGTAGNVEPDSITFDYCRKYVDDFVLVSEDEIIQGLKFGLIEEHLLLEGAAGVAIAALLKNQESAMGKTIVVVLCGANISLETLDSIISE
jgi:threonine dehydratase